MIHISLSPNVEKEDILAAGSRLISFLKWKKNDSQHELTREIAEYFDKNNGVYLFNSARSALYVFLSSLNLKENDEIILQAFTCSAVPNAIRWAGAKPVFVDINDSLNIDPNKLENIITDRTKAIIIQHTFGIPANIEKICALAKSRDLTVIEDCAHALGATYQDRKVGLFGDATLLSFGRDKVISCVYGGALILNNKKFINKLEEVYKTIKYPKIFWSYQQLIHPIITVLALETYEWAGKYILFIAQKMHLLSYAVTKEERIGKKPTYFPARLSESLAYLALTQFKKLQRFNDHRKRLASIYTTILKETSLYTMPKNYDEGSIFLRFPIFTENPEKIINYLRERDIIIGDWYRPVIAPKGTNLNIVGYTEKSNPKAEKASLTVFNLPTNIRTSEYHAKRIAELLLSYERSRN